MTPVVYLLGWRGGYLLPLVSLAGTLLVMARWLRVECRSPMGDIAGIVSVIRSARQSGNR